MESVPMVCSIHRYVVVRGGERGTPMATVAAAAAAAVLRIWGDWARPDESRQRDDTVPAKVCLCGGEEGEFPGTASLPFPSLSASVPRGMDRHIFPRRRNAAEKKCVERCVARKCENATYVTMTLKAHYLEERVKTPPMTRLLPPVENKIVS